MVEGLRLGRGREGMVESGCWLDAGCFCWWGVKCDGGLGRGRGREGLMLGRGGRGGW